MNALATITLDWRDGIAILSVLFGLGSLVVAYYEHRRAESARGAEKRVRLTLYRQRAAQFFGTMSRDAAHLASLLRGREWPDAAELGTSLGGSISNATGFCGKLMVDTEKESLELAAKNLREVLEAVPLAEQQPTDEIVRSMMDKCIVVVYGIQQITGRMQYLDELEDAHEQ
jgi:hypothetical protein